jgi:hypothetical protein
VLPFAATTALPYEHLERPAAGLRAELRRQLLQANGRELPAWDTFAVEGPVQAIDTRGRTWFEYRASVETRGPIEKT